MHLCTNDVCPVSTFFPTSKVLLGQLAKVWARSLASGQDQPFLSVETFIDKCTLPHQPLLRRSLLKCRAALYVLERLYAASVPGDWDQLIYMPQPSVVNCILENVASCHQIMPS
eukprot:scaffold116060_cov17-Tisochrysis_lutea.AAC.1